MSHYHISEEKRYLKCVITSRNYGVDVSEFKDRLDIITLRHLYQYYSLLTAHDYKGKVLYATK